MIKKELHHIHGNNGYNYAKKYFDRNKLAVNYINEIKRIVEV